ncbi:MAG: PIN domain-containing protein [Ilumatobacter sp.]|jgi:predicted nucleic acid-binding protein|nr:MAG: PIN domain-containing protein [Ilumatobacter sp.]
MLIVDASCLYEVVADTPAAEPIRQRLSLDDEHAAPHVIDVEVLGVVRRHLATGRLEAVAATQAIDDLHLWPGERVGHRSLLDRMWELRSSVRPADAAYVALAEAFEATLLTTDARLANASGPQCKIEVFQPST